MFNVEVPYQTLSQYLVDIKEIFQNVSDFSWIVAEIARIDSDKNGNYWFELVEKSNGEIIAQAGAVIWRGNGSTVQNFYLKTGVNLQRGLKILFLGKATFHEKYGFKISIYQIDPSYTIGEMEIKKKEVLLRLEREGLIDKNKVFEIPLVIQRIAIISSETAAGYEDFIKMLRENEYGFKFYTRLYDSFVQGQEAVFSIVNAFKQCALEYEKYDVVVLIRGGGAVVDLQCFDEYEIAKSIAIMPLPVFTGIGHTRDKTVADMVAHSSFKTPSDLAKYILERASNFDNQIENLKNSLFSKVKYLLNLESSKINNYTKNLKISSKSFLDRLGISMSSLLADTSKTVFKKINSEREKLFRYKNLFHRNTNQVLRSEIIKINSLSNKALMRLSKFLTESRFSIVKYEQFIVEKAKNSMNIKTLYLRQISEKLRLLSPENILRRGYSITYFKGKALKDAKNVRNGDIIEVYLYRGQIIGQVRKKEDLDGSLKLF